MGESGVVAVQAIVNLLNRREPAALAELRARFPSQANLLEPGKRLGPEAAAESEMLKELARLTIVVAKTESETVSQKVRRRIRMSSRLRLAGAMVASLSSGGLVAALSQGSTAVALVSGCIAFLSSSFTLIAQYLEDYSGGKNSLRELRDRVMAHVADTYEVDAEFSLMMTQSDYSGLETLIRKLNVALSSLRQIQMAVE
jgi:hypothetical protein